MKRKYLVIVIAMLAFACIASAEGRWGDTMVDEDNDESVVTNGSSGSDDETMMTPNDDEYNTLLEAIQVIHAERGVQDATKYVATYGRERREDYVRKNTNDLVNRVGSATLYWASAQTRMLPPLVKVEGDIKCRLMFLNIKTGGVMRI